MYWFIVDPKGYRKEYKKEHTWRGVDRRGRASQIQPVKGHDYPSESPFTYQELQDQYQEQVDIRKNAKKGTTQKSSDKVEVKAGYPLPSHSTLEEAVMKPALAASDNHKGLALDMMITDIEPLTDQDTLLSAMEKLYGYDLHFLPVVTEKEKKLCGLMGREDLLEQMVAQGLNRKDLEKQKVYDLMISPILSCTEECGIPDLVTLMLNERLDCVPVTNSKEELRGMIRWVDVCTYLGLTGDLIKWDKKEEK